MARFAGKLRSSSTCDIALCLDKQLPTDAELLLIRSAAPQMNQPDHISDACNLQTSKDTLKVMIQGSGLWRDIV